MKLGKAEQQYNFRAIFQRTKPWQKTLFLSLIILIIGFVFFWPATKQTFLGDDYAWVNLVQEKTISWQDMQTIFLDPEAQINGYIRPIVSVSFLVDHLLWGINPAGYYFLNILIYSLSAIFVFIIIKRLLNNGIKKKAESKKITFFAWLAGLLFLFLPIHTDTVFWLADRTDLLALFFGLAATLTFLRYRHNNNKTNTTKRKRWSLFATFVFLFLAFFSKEGAIIFPAILFAYDFLYFIARRKISWREFILTYAVLGTSVMAYILIRWGIFSDVAETATDAFKTSGDFAVDLSVGGILGKLNRYVYWFLFPFSAYATRFGAYPILLIVTGVVTLWAALRKKGQLIWFGLLWILISFVPLLILGNPIRWRAAIPSVGFVIVITAIFYYLSKIRLPKFINKIIRYPKLVMTLFASGLLGILILIGLITLVHERTEWQKVSAIERNISAELLSVLELTNCDVDERVYFINQPAVYIKLATRHLGEKPIHPFTIDRAINVHGMQAGGFPEVIAVSKISVDSIEDSRSSAIIRDNNTIETSANRYWALNTRHPDLFSVESKKNEEDNNYERIIRFNTDTLQESGVIEYKDGHLRVLQKCQ